MFFQGPKLEVENISFRKDNRATCRQHHEELSSLYCRESLFGKRDPFAACSQCSDPQGVNQKTPANFQIDSENQCYIVSPLLSIKSSEFQLTAEDPVLEFGSEVMENMLCDSQATGYGLKSLVYMKDQKVLATCSTNGSICFWSIGDKIELKGPKLNLETTINFAKYCVFSDEKKCFIVGTNKGLFLYNMAEEGGIRFLTSILGEIIVSDVDFLKEENKMITVESEYLVKVWNLDSFEVEEKIDLQRYDIKGKIHNVIYMERTKELAIEHEMGLSIIDWQSRGDNYVKPKVRHHIVADKKTFGCIHLPKSKKFVLNNGSFDIQVLNEEDFSELNRYSEGNTWAQSYIFPMKFVSTNDESRILSTTQGMMLMELMVQSLHCPKHYLKSFITNIGGMELIEDQYRLAVAHKNKGIVTIHRINHNMRIKKPGSESKEEFLPHVEYNWTNIDSRPSGDLFSSSRVSSGVPSGGLFSSEVSSGDLFPSQRNNSRSSRTSLFDSSRGNSNKVPALGKPKQAPKPTKKGKKLKKVEITSKTLKKKETKRKSKSEVVKSSLKPSPKSSKISKKKQIQDKEDNVSEIVRIRTKKGGKSKAKEEKAWIVYPSDEEGKRGRSKEKEDQKQKNKSKKVDASEGSRSLSNSKSLTRKSK